jgi:DNA-damage-inducible protein D
MRNELSNGNIPVFEQIKRLDENGTEFWSSRELAKVFDYSEYRHFLPAIKRAKEACLKSGQDVENHFEDMLDMVSIGSGAKRKTKSVKLSRYACYLIVQNADPAKELVALGQTYFAVQTRLNEIRHKFSSQQILDHMGSTELAANLFRATQTEEKLRRENIKGKPQANQTHYEVGKKVRQTIEELGGTMPENLPVEDSILKLERKEKKKIG